MKDIKKKLLKLSKVKLQKICQILKIKYTKKDSKIKIIDMLLRPLKRKYKMALISAILSTIAFNIIPAICGMSPYIPIEKQEIWDLGEINPHWYKYKGRILGDFYQRNAWMIEEDETEKEMRE